MKKLSILMTIFMMAVGVAQAANVYPLWVKGVQVTSDNRRDVLEDGTVWVDVWGNRLSLFFKDADISISGAGKHVVRFDADAAFKELIIDLQGTNTFTCQSANVFQFPNGGEIELDGSADAVLNIHPRYHAFYCNEDARLTFGMATTSAPFQMNIQPLERCVQPAFAGNEDKKVTLRFYSVNADIRVPEGKAITYGINDVIVAGQLSLLPEGTAWNKSQKKFMVNGAELTDSLMIVAPEPTIKYGIQIGDLELTSKNYENIEVGGSAGTVTYDPEEKVLTLENFIYNSNFGMVAVLDITTDNLTINLVGENRIISSNLNTMRVEPQTGAQGTIVFTGTGSLSLNSQYTAIELSRTVTMTVDGCQLDISGSEYGIYGRDAMISCMPETDEAASLVVTNGAALTVSGGTGGSINGLKSLVLDEDMAILSPEGAEFVTDCENFHYGVVKDGNYVRTAVEIGVRPADGIEDIIVDGVQNKKVLVDGVLYIVREGKLYTVEGTEVR